MFITDALAATETAAAAEANPLVGFLVQLVLVFIIFYFLLLRPQQKKMKEHENMLNSITAKDEILTGGGIYARVVEANGDILFVEIAKGVEIKISRSSVKEVVSSKKTVS